MLGVRFVEGDYESGPLRADLDRSVLFAPRYVRRAVVVMGEQVPEVFHLLPVGFRPQNVQTATASARVVHEPHKNPIADQEKITSKYSGKALRPQVLCLHHRYSDERPSIAEHIE